MCEVCSAVGPAHIQLEGSRLLAAIVKNCHNSGEFPGVHVIRMRLKVTVYCSTTLKFAWVFNAVQLVKEALHMAMVTLHQFLPPLNYS